MTATAARTGPVPAAAASLRMGVAATAWAGLAALAALAPPVHACGVCDEDRIAATYDHANVQRAARAGRQMVVVAVDGPFDVARAAQAARRLRGVDPLSVRVAATPGALSFALERGRAPASAVTGLRQALPGTRLALIE